METVTCNRCGLIDDYAIKISGPHKSAYCNGCGRYIKHLPQNTEFIMPFGKYKGRHLSSMVSVEEIGYIKWLLSQNPKNSLKDKLQAHIDRCN
jgi:uncharacterized protein (DUF3820 family)